MDERHEIRHKSLKAIGKETPDGEKLWCDGVKHIRLKKWPSTDLLEFKDCDCAMTDMYPREFTSEEGGSFRLWDHGPVSGEMLRTARNGGPVTIINGWCVHSLAFESPLAGYGRFARWDCVNGWTTTIEQAKERWPNGLHGAKPYEGRAT